MTQLTFPVGYYQLHQNPSMNFQMNRWFNWVGEQAMLEEMRAVAPRIRDYGDWKREFLALADIVSRAGHVLRAGFYYRSAEFFMRADDVDRKVAREKFLSAIRAVYRLHEIDQHAIAYVDGHREGFLPAYRFTPTQARGAIVFFGGFDSYIEELAPLFFYLRDAGYETIAFEGPGQGGALNEAGLPMTHEWHKPVKAILDYFGLDQVTLVGLSLGGCLALRAAAFEPRIARVIAYDVLSDFLEANLRQVRPLTRRLLNVQLHLGAAPLVNGLVKRALKTNPVLEWGLYQGMHVTGTSSPYEYLQNLKRFNTADVSPLVKQDVLLLAGSEDHFVPVEQFHRQIKMLTHARSLTARLFTSGESAQNHCQVGNYGLAFATIVNWIDTMQTAAAQR
ncbi:MAG: alpha/beta fold hydrolase [Anaerolineales bacterium]